MALIRRSPIAGRLDCSWDPAPLTGGQGAPKIDWGSEVVTDYQLDRDEYHVGYPGPCHATVRSPVATRPCPRRHDARYLAANRPSTPFPLTIARDSVRPFLSRTQRSVSVHLGEHGPKRIPGEP